VLNESYELKKALLVYHKVEVERLNLDDLAPLKPPAIYIEEHNIRHRKGSPPSLLAGKPLSMATVKAIANQFSKINKLSNTSGLLPKNLLAYNPNLNGLAWWSPAQKRHLSFSKDLGISSGHYHLPALLFLVIDKTLWLYALDNSRRPSEKSQLFKAPFHNMIDDDSVCMGNTTLPSFNGSLPEFMHGWEVAFFGSEFSHIGNGSVINNGSIDTLFKGLANNGGKFPIEMLLPFDRKLTLDDLFESKGI
jgi:PRTRC genetic system protein B